MPATDGEFIAVDEFKQWDREFVSWKLKRDASLFNVFQSIEQCSVAILNRTTPAFLKILRCYFEEIAIKKETFKQQQLKMAEFYEPEFENPIKDYLFQHEQWFNSLLARMEACAKFLYDCAAKYDLMKGNNSINSLQVQFFSTHRPPEFDDLLAAYLASVVRYNQARATLCIEENKLSDLNGEFIEKILRAGSFKLLDQETCLFIEFHKQIDKVNQLHGSINQEYENRQQIKTRLIEIVHPSLLQFYIDRINPRDKVEAINYQLALPVVYTTACPSSFYYSVNSSTPSMSSNDSAQIYYSQRI